MSLSRIAGVRIAGISTCVPPRCVDNLECGAAFGEEEVRKVVAMAGIQRRHVVDPGTTATDLCFEAAQNLMRKLDWSPDSITGLILVTQSPDYFLPSSSCMVHKWLGLGSHCASFDVGLGCSGYPYGLYLAAAMLNAGGQQRILMLHGETPSLFPNPDDHATTLLFGDAGAATALELSPDAVPMSFGLHTDGNGYAGLIIRGGAFRQRMVHDPRDLCLHMDGAGIFNFTISRVPALIKDTLAFAGATIENIDAFAFHQSNRFIMRHLMKKCGLPEVRVPMVLDRFGNAGGPSVALAITQGLDLTEPRTRQLMLLGYGVGLSWSSAVLRLDAVAPLLHGQYSGTTERR
jgi:3-oxoacyl-[acyl-carrier-protein] synthase III